MGAAGYLHRLLDDDADLLRLARTPDLPLGRAVLIGLVAAVAALSLRVALGGLYGHLAGFTILLPGVILASLAGGAVAGAVCVAACLGGGVLLLQLSGGDPALFASRMGLVATLNFIIVGLFAIILAASLRRTLLRLDASIAALKESTARAHESETHLKAMVDQASAGIARLNLDGSVASANARFAEILGRTPETLLGATTVEVTHPDDVAPTVACLDDAAHGRGGQLEKRYVRPDGSVVWALTSMRPVTDETGEITGYIAVIIDITDAKAVEAALRESETRFRLLADTAPSPVWMTNAEGELEFVNAALAEFYGRSREAVMGHLWRDTVHPDDLAAVPQVVQPEPRPRQLPYGFEARFRRGDGVWRWMRVQVSPRFDARKRFIGYVGMAFDVTDSREALEALARQERRQTFLLELTDRLRDLTDLEEIMAEVQRSLGDVLGADRVGYGEVDQERGVVSMSRDWTSGVASAHGRFSLDTFGADLISDLAAGRVIRIPDVREDPRTAEAAKAFDSIQTRALVRAPLIRSGRLRAFLYVHSARPRRWSEAEVALVEEVAARTWAELERARTEAELRESEQRFRAIADTAPVLIWVTDQDRTHAFVNQAYVAFFGGTYEEARLRDWREALHPDDQQRIIEEAAAGEATRQPFSMEARHRRADGQYRWLKSFSRPRIAAGEVVGFVGVAFDVTEAKQAADDLKRINELLEERVGEALAEKAKAEADLMHAQRMEAIGRLTGGVAHDFNNLLTVVIGALDIILRSPDEAKRQMLGEAALAAARRGERLTHQLLAFSRRQALRPEPVDLNGLIRESEPLLRRAVGEAVEFKLKLKRGAARVNVDPAQFEAALLNLIVNARDAVSDGGHITVQTAACYMEAGEVAELPVGEYLCVTVTDDGVGMAPEVIDRVFEPFFTTKSVGKGTGLGLSQVYGFARQTGGGVRIRSTPGRGSEITLYLPPYAADAVQPIETAQAEPRAWEGPGRRLLLVEDDAGVAAVAVDLLADMGLEVTAVETAPQALEVLQADGFDIMLTDIIMPGGMNGLELARQASSAHPQMRIILASGYAGDDVDEALADAPWPLLRKPYSAGELRRILHEGAPLPA